MFTLFKNASNFLGRLCLLILTGRKDWIFITQPLSIIDIRHKLKFNTIAPYRLKDAYHLTFGIPCSCEEGNLIFCGTTESTNHTVLLHYSPVQRMLI